MGGSGLVWNSRDQWSSNKHFSLFFWQGNKSEFSTRLSLLKKKNAEEIDIFNCNFPKKSSMETGKTTCNSTPSTPNSTPPSNKKKLHLIAWGYVPSSTSTSMILRVSPRHPVDLLTKITEDGVLLRWICFLLERNFLMFFFVGWGGGGGVKGASMRFQIVVFYVFFLTDPTLPTRVVVLVVVVVR